MNGFYKYKTFHGAKAAPTCLLPSISVPLVVQKYETSYMEAAKRKSAEKVKDDVKENSTVGTVSKTEAGGVSEKSKSVSSSATEQDLDVFLLGDLGDSDDGPDDADEGFDDDFDKL